MKSTSEVVCCPNLHRDHAAILFHYTELRATMTAYRNLLKGLVGARGFEPRTSCAQGRRATRLRYAPTGE